jgi:tRNA 2-selenouridine synthase
MINRIPAEQFLAMAQSVPVIDVRSPAEYARGHIPGAQNVPLFDNMERADVGSVYHRSGREEAVRKGLEIVGPKMQKYLDEALKLAADGEVLVYCWRGGMRSESMAWLFSTAGIKAAVLEKGYKGFRTFIRSSFERPQPMIVIGGKTGTGKTEIIRRISEMPIAATSPDHKLQVVDLESLANHKGSVFSSLGLPDQPSNEHFENLLGMTWLGLDPSRLVILEDESFNIGKVSLPKPIHVQMQAAPMIYVDMPMDSRVERLFREYASFPAEVLKQMIYKISRRLGGSNTKEALQAIDGNRLRDAIRISLLYYDKAYSYDMQSRNSGKIYHLTVLDNDIGRLIPEILKASSELNLRTDTNH